MDTYAKAVNMLKKAITNAINKAIENGELPQAELPQFIIETPGQNSRRLCHKRRNGRRKIFQNAAVQNCAGYNG